MLNKHGPSGTWGMTLPEAAQRLSISPLELLKLCRAHDELEGYVVEAFRKTESELQRRASAMTAGQLRFELTRLKRLKEYWRRHVKAKEYFRCGK